MIERTTSTMKEQLELDEVLAIRLQQQYDDEAKKKFDRLYQQRQEEKAQKRQAKRNLKTDGMKESQSSRRSIFIRCEIEQYKIAVLVDTGASHSFMSKQMMNQLKLHHKLDLRHAGGAVITTTTDCNQVVGTIRYVACRVGSNETTFSPTFHHFFHILEKGPSPIIVGMDLFDRFGCAIDFNERTITFNGDLNGFPVPFLTDEDAQQLNGISH